MLFGTTTAAQATAATRTEIPTGIAMVILTGIAAAVQGVVPTVTPTGIATATQMVIPMETPMGIVTATPMETETVILMGMAITNSC